MKKQQLRVELLRATSNKLQVKETGYRLRNPSYIQSVAEDVPSSIRNKDLNKQNSETQDHEDFDEMGSIEDLLPPKFLLRKEDFEKKNNTNKIDAVFEAVNKLYNHHAQVSARTKSLEYAVFDQEDGILPQLNGVATFAKSAQDKQDLLTKEVLALREELDIAKGLIQKQSKQIKELKAKQVDLTARSMANNLTISGINGDTKDADVKSQLYNFLEEELGIDMEEQENITKVHRLGPPIKDGHRAIVFLCPDGLRKKIFENVTRLAGKPFSINQQLPDALAEQRREFRQTMKEIKTLERDKEEQDKSTFLIRNSKLYINGQLKRKELLPPSPADLFACSSEIKKMKALKMLESKTKSAKSCSFKAYACITEKMNDVHLAYKKLFRENPEADHIAAAFNAEGTEGYQDDSEFGSGFRLLYTIRDSRLLNVAVFVVRHYGGEHLGPQRFAVMKELAEEALYKLS